MAALSTLTESHPVEIWLAVSANRRFPYDSIIASLSCMVSPVLVKPTCTHVWIVAVFSDGTTAAIEAVPPAIRRFDPAEKVGQQTRYYKADVTPTEAAAIWAEAERHIGRKYDYLGCGLAILCAALHKPSILYWRRARLECAALAGWCLYVGTGRRVRLLSASTPFDDYIPTLVENSMMRLRWEQRHTLPTSEGATVRSTTDPSPFLLAKEAEQHGDLYLTVDGGTHYCYQYRLPDGREYWVYRDSGGSLLAVTVKSAGVFTRYLC